jgi:DNA-binding beta-propeller fold protein YncE
MVAMNRREFLRLGASGLAIAALPLTGCVTAGPSLIEHGPGALAIADDGTRYEVVPDHHQLMITRPGGSARRVGRLGRAAGQLNYPVAVVVVGGLAHVVEVGNHRVQVFDRDGRSQAILGADELLYPCGITARGGRLFVADTGHGEVVELAPGGGAVRRFGRDRLMAPRGLAPLDDHLLVADAGRRQVVELGDNGAIVRAFDGDWVLPYGVATDGDTVYVADRSRPELAVFDRGGQRTGTLPLGDAASYVVFAGDELFVG